MSSDTLLRTLDAYADVEIRLESVGLSVFVRGTE